MWVLNMLKLILGASLVLVSTLNTFSCHNKAPSSLKGVDTIGDHSSCKNTSTVWLENYKTFAEHHKIASRCMDALTFKMQDQLKLKIAGTNYLSVPASPHSEMSKKCFAAVDEIIAAGHVKTNATDEENAKTITELFMALQNKCLGVQGFEDRQTLVAWLIENNKVLATEKWRTGLFIYPFLPQENRGAQVYDAIRPKENDSDYEKKFEFYSICRRTADAGLEQYLRLQKYSYAFEAENCTDPTKNWDRSIPNTQNVWTCDSPCRYSGTSCNRCSLKGAKNSALSCATEIGARHGLENWCKNTLGLGCEDIICEKTNQDDIIVGERFKDGKWIKESAESETGGNTCISSSEGSTIDFSVNLAGKMSLWFGADIDTPFGGVEAGAKNSVVKGKEFRVTGDLVSGYNICSPSFQPWIKRKDETREADHTSYFTCTANMDRLSVTTDALSTELEVSVKTKSPVVKVEVGGQLKIEESAKQYGKKSIVWMSRPISAAGSTPDVLRATCQEMVKHWKNHSLQSYLSEPGENVYMLARKIGGIQEGYCTEDSDCKSTLYNGTNTWRGKVYRCIKPKDSQAGKCHLRSTGRYVGADNNWCGERCEDGIDFLGGVGGSGQPICDTKGGFSCVKTTIPYSGWHWAWQDPKELTETVYQCLPKSHNGRFAPRNICRRQPGIYGD